MTRTLYLVAGEHSGDTRGAELMLALKKRLPQVKFNGLGGAKMREISGGAVHDWVEDAAVVGLWEVLKRYRWFRARFEETKNEIAELDPAAVIFIDYPGFNLRLARDLRAGGTRAKLVDFISPQVWAWHKERLVHMADYLDLMLCLFPFEKPLFEQAGLRTVWMGHPMVDQLEEKRIAGGREDDLVGLFPGSREREVARLFPVMVESAMTLHAGYPDWKFEAAAASDKLAGMMANLVREAGAPDGLVRIRTGTSQELMQRAASGVVASGTATLEASWYGLPYCLVYKVAWPTYLAARIMVELDFIGMVNILAGRQVVHEFVQGEANAGNVTAFLESVMTDAVLRKELQSNLLSTAALLGAGGAAGRAADAIADLLE